ncbi:hypothetical protein TEA_019154 [Camellia sinensis var. sinensis]|uniref:Uncharacterized protein n=1 Tax=Camellia sinensis var. sinensis TaxID=542762 RepID=A0A4S4EIL5_CAMSN|nr:hypothetical protein TEA_019154 [Camellia sinensis var. sinensis]
MRGLTPLFTVSTPATKPKYFQPCFRALLLNAQIVLDEFNIVLHSSDSIAPVGILHTMAFHLESKLGTESLCDSGGSNGIFLEKMDAVCEVLGDCLQRCEVECQSVDDLAKVTEHKLHISKTKKDNIFSISCWLQDACKTSSVANETYVRFITQEKCQFGVPSRSTIELPLLQVGLGRAYIEVLVANDQSKRVLHVQSISCWAPSCIGPYSQRLHFLKASEQGLHFCLGVLTQSCPITPHVKHLVSTHWYSALISAYAHLPYPGRYKGLPIILAATLHREVLHMAGQLGLDPPTMLLCSGGPTAELELALQNSEAVAKCFHCSISTSAILFTIYCSAYIPSSDRITIQGKLNTFLKQMKLLNLRGENKTEVLDSIVLYVLVPDLPKRASVEVKPVLYAADDTETKTDFVTQDLSIETAQSYWGFGHEDWHDSCFQKCIIHGKICAAVLSITDELAAKICSECAGENQEVCPNSRTERQMDRLARFCIFLIDGFLSENHFSWNDVTSGVWNWDSEQKSGSFEFSQELCMCNGEVLHEQNWSEGWVSCCSRSARAAMNSAYDVAVHRTDHPVNSTEPGALNIIMDDHYSLSTKRFSIPSPLPVGSSSGFRFTSSSSHFTNPMPPSVSLQIEKANKKRRNGEALLPEIAQIFGD